MPTAQVVGIRQNPTTRIRQADVARIEGVNKNYGPVQALVDFNFEVRAGELVALLGPNGAGKTTAIKLLLGLATPNRGKVSVFGADPASAASHTRVGAMLQVGRVPETLRVREHIDLFSSYYPNPLALAETLAIAGLEDLRDLIAEGTPAEIKARTAGKKIRCITELSSAVIQSLSGVSAVQQDRGATVIHTSRAEDVLRGLLKLDLEISEIEVSSAGLEEAFLALTRENKV